MRIFTQSPKKVQYTEADLDWRNENSRSSVEMKNTASHPEIEHLRDDIADYDIIFLVFTIWWYVAPMLINSFFESYDMKGKIIVLFATFDGSGMGKTIKKLRLLCLGVKLVDGNVLSEISTSKELSEWVTELKI